MEGGTENDLLSLDASTSGENGDKQQEGGSEKQGKKRDSELEIDASLHCVSVVWCSEKPAFVVSEQSEEDKQLAEQAKEYGKMRTQGEGKEAESDEPLPPGMDESKDSEDGEGTAAAPGTEQEMEGVESQEGGANGDPRPLHLTRSVYIRHIPAKVSAESIVEICRTIPGYLRIAFADPNPERE